MQIPFGVQIALTILLASIPALLWGLIFYRKDKVSKSRAIFSFLLGALAVTPILAYKWLWQYFPSLNIFSFTSQFNTDLLGFTSALVLPLGTVLSFVFVGIIEEYMKNLAVRKADQGFFRNIDDAIEFSIMAALGFAFLENCLYFYYIWEQQGQQVLMTAFIFRGIFSTFAHVLFSGIYGYYYGLAYFAEPVWSEKQRKKRHSILTFFHKITHLKESRVYSAEKMTEGLVIAASLHAVFNILLELGLTSFILPYLIAGYILLDSLFKKKENLKDRGHLLGEASPEHTHEWLHRKVHGLG